MIINVRGGHGSGKTTLVRRVMEYYDCTAHFTGRKIPTGYTCYPRERYSQAEAPPLWVSGSYLNACGGCDSMKDIVTIHEVARLQSKDFHVLYEGIVAQHSFPRTVELAKSGVEFVGVLIDTPLQTCIDSVQERRREAEKEPLTKLTNLENEWKRAYRDAARLRSAGLQIRTLDRAAALDLVLTLLRYDL